MLALILGPAPALLAADTPSTDPVAIFGVAGFTVAILLYFLRVAWGEIQALRTEVRELNKSLLEQSRVSIEVAQGISRAAEALRESRVDNAELRRQVDRLAGIPTPTRARRQPD